MSGSPFVPIGAPATFERTDQGVDFRTTPGGPLIAPWAGTVSLANPNPGGFGTHYPLYTPSSGPYAGHTFYLGHTYAATTGPVQPGQAISHTGTGSESWMGNAVGIPGHAEVGLLLPGGGYPSMSGGAALKSFVLGQSTQAATDASTSSTSSSSPSALDLAGDLANPPKFLGDLAQLALAPLEQSGVRILLYAVLVIGGMALLAGGVGRVGGARPQPKGDDLVAATA